jgi:flagellar operon protein
MSAIDNNKQFLYPNVTSIPGQGNSADSKPVKKEPGAKSEFDQVFDQTIGKSGERTLPGNLEAGSGLDQIKAPLKFSSHAAQRLKDRKIVIDQATMLKVNDAIDKADAKGIDDTLILTKDAALIVSVKNRTVITAMDKNSLTGNVFTNIDGAVIV